MRHLILFAIFLASLSAGNATFSETNSFYIGLVYIVNGAPETFPLYHDHGDQIYIMQKTQSPAASDGHPTASSNIR